MDLVAFTVAILFILLLLFLLTIVYTFRIPFRISKNVSDCHASNNSRNDLPPPIPNGWIPIALSQQVENGKEGINVKILNSYQVKLSRDENQVLKHQFLEETINYNLIIKESSGFIMTWFHSENEEPSFEVPDIISTEKDVLGGFFDVTCDAHIADFLENSADMAHFNTIHGPSLLFYDNFFSYLRSEVFTFLFGRHDYEGHWSVIDRFTASLKLRTTSKFFNCKINENVMMSNGYGPYVSTSSHGDHVKIGFGLIPVDDHKLRLLLLFYHDKTVSGFLMSLILTIVSLSQILRDCKIFKHKKYLKHPKLVSCEKEIVIFRKWFSHFYTKNSPRSFEELK